jgi:hypothetical protein
MHAHPITKIQLHLPFVGLIFRDSQEIWVETYQIQTKIKKISPSVSNICKIAPISYIHKMLPYPPPVSNICKIAPVSYVHRVSHYRLRGLLIVWLSRTGFGFWNNPWTHGRSSKLWARGQRKIHSIHLHLDCDEPPALLIHFLLHFLLESNLWKKKIKFIFSWMSSFLVLLWFIKIWPLLLMFILLKTPRGIRLCLISSGDWRPCWFS